MKHDISPERLDDISYRARFGLPAKEEWSEWELAKYQYITRMCR